MTVRRPITVFISSDMKELEYDRQIAEQALKDMNVNPILFEVFPAMNSSVSESYTQEVRDCDIFLLLVWKSFRPPVEGEYIEAVKQNKPILILAKSLNENEERASGLKAFLDRLSPESPERPPRRVTYKNYRKVNELRATVQDSVAAEIAKFYKEPIHTKARNEMYDLGTFIIRNAQRRLYLFQWTPSLILGARPYLSKDSMKYAYEKEFADALKTWIDDNYKLSEKEFLYLFSTKATRQEIKKEHLEDNTDCLSDIERRARWLKEIEAQSGRRFRIAKLDVPMSGPLIVGDNRYAIWVLGKDQAVAISQENHNICNILVRILNSYSQKSESAKDILSALGL